MYLDDKRSKSISDILLMITSALRRYWRIAWPPALMVTALVGLLTVRLASYYSSDVTILARPRQIKTGVVAAREKDEQEERLEVLQQELLARPRLRSIIERFNLYPEFQGVVGKEFALRKFQKAVKLTPAVSPAGKPLLNTFTVAFTHRDPDMAYNVTKELSNLFIEESLIVQRSETQGTEEFLESQLREARRRLEEMEMLRKDFVEKNNGKLPEHREQAMALFQNYQNQLNSNNQLLATNTARLGYLQREVKLASSDFSVTGGPADMAASPEDSLAQLESALVVLRSRYSDSHPDVINTRKRIAALRARIGSGEERGGKGRSYTGGSAEARQLRREIGEIEAQSQGLVRENEELKKRIALLDRDIRDMPLKEQELIKINRDYNNTRDNYSKLAAAKENAAIESSLVKSQKGSQFKIVEPPIRPVTPAGPDRPLIAGIGVIGGLVIFLTMPLGFFFGNSAFKFRDDAEEDLGVKVIGVIPPMNTPAVRAHFRRAGAASLVASVISFFLGSAVILLLA